MIEVLFAVREDQFEENSAIPTSLDFVAEMNQLTYMLTLDSTCQPEPISAMLTKINHRSTDSTSTQYFQDLFPYDSPNNT
ncbi:unnamed protein product [Rotaria sp. Silwood2]|nr:unnamed protein product [Rotaria sp. Silwood2]CAF4318248.1 unnamed protein product [Rotaria sp. Silwood2]